jgi:hypothetical protein
MLAAMKLALIQLTSGADMFAQACTEAILRASSCGGMLSYRDLCPSAFVSQ